MGSKRTIYNQSLMETTDYSEPSTFRRLFGSWYWLKGKCESGDGVALSIYIDLKQMLGEYGIEETPLDERDIFILKKTLIEGHTQAEVGRMIDLHQTWIGNLLERSLQKVSDYLSE